MVSRSFVKGLVVVAMMSQMAFGKNYTLFSYELPTDAVFNACSKVGRSAAEMAKNGYHAVANSNAVHVMGEAAGNIKDGFIKAGMTINGGATRFYVAHEKACIAGLTLTGVAVVYALYNYNKACKAKKQLEKLTYEGYIKE